MSHDLLRLRKVARQVGRGTHDLHPVPLTSRGSSTSPAARSDSGGNTYRGDQARRIGLTLPGDIKSSAVRDARSDDRQAQCDVDSPLEPDCLQCDMTLIVIHRHHGIVGAVEGVEKERVIRVRSGRVEALALRSNDSGSDERLLFVAKETVLSGVGIQRCHGDPWRHAAGHRPHGFIGESDLRQDRFLA